MADRRSVLSLQRQPQADPYLSALAANSGQGAYGFLNMAALRNQSGGQGDNTRYLAELEMKLADQDAQQAELDRQSKLAMAYLPTAAGQAQAGISGAIQVNAGGYLGVNRDQLRQADTVNLDRTGQAAQLDAASAVGKLADAGVMPSDVPERIAGPLDESVPTVAPYVTPGDAAAQTTAQAAVQNAGANYLGSQAQMVEAGKRPDPDQQLAIAAAGGSDKPVPYSLPGAAQTGEPTQEMKYAAAKAQYLAQHPGANVRVGTNRATGQIVLRDLATGKDYTVN